MKAERAIREPSISEKALQTAVLELARVLGWKAYHTFDSRRSEPGFPDLCLVRERVVFVELKSRRGNLSPAQVSWLAALRSAGAEVYVFKPRDWQSGYVERCLRHKAPGRREA